MGYTSNGMHRPSDQDLLALLKDTESDRSERKERLAGDAPTKLREAICAFANDLPGYASAGVAFVGAKDDGTHAGVPITDELLRSLADMKTDGSILPMPSMTVEKRMLDGKEYAVIVVAPSDEPPVRYKGRVYVRVGPRRAIASPQDERTLAERRRSKDLPFELQPVRGSKLGDLDRSIFENEYLPSAFAPEVLEQNGRTYPEKLAALRMVHAATDPIPTVLGLLVLGPNGRDYIACAYVQFLRVDGVDLASPILDSEELGGPLGQMLRRLDDKLAASNTTRVDLTSSSTEIRSPEYPISALQQITRNAVMHRTYEGTNAPIRVTWFSDRIEVLSPGGPFGLVTRANFGSPGVADYRNRSIAEAMKTLGFVQRFGVGIATAKSQLKNNGNPPLEWSVEDTYILFTLRKRP